MARALEGAATLDDMLKAFQRWADAIIGDVAWTVFEVEFATRARQDEQVQRGLAERNARIRDAVTVLLTEHAKVLGIELPMPAEDCATAVLSLGVGPGVQRALDRRSAWTCSPLLSASWPAGSRRGFPLRRAESLPTAERTDLGFYGP